MTAQFPIALDPQLKAVPVSVLAPHEAQALKNHGKNLKTLAAQGGLTPEEAVAIIEGRPWERMAFSEARQKLLDYVAGATREPEPAPEESPAILAINDAIRIAENIRSGLTPPTRHAFNKLIITMERARGLV